MDREDIVIIGGGLCGLTTALGLHRKGLKSIVLEKSEKLRGGGLVITIFTNGWRALDQLGVASKLREVSFPVHGIHDINLDNGSERRTPGSKEEIRSFRRIHLIEALAKELPEDTIRFGCQISAITTDPNSSYPLIHLDNGTVIKAKVVIGCDGTFSRVADYVGLKPVKRYSMACVRGLTNYPTGHHLKEKLLTRTKKGRDVIIGRIPMGDNIIYWYLVMKSPTKDSGTLKHSDMKGYSMQAVKDFPSDIVNMVDQSDNNTLHFNNLHYRPPWSIYLENFHKGNVIVAGDAMHVMAPALAQGGSAALEDSVVLARCMAQKMVVEGSHNGPPQMIDWGNVRLAFDQFVKERKSRIWWLSLNTHVVVSFTESSTKAVRFLCMLFLISLFRKPLWDSQYDCGRL